MQQAVHEGGDEHGLAGIAEPGDAEAHAPLGQAAADVQCPIEQGHAPAMVSVSGPRPLRPHEALRWGASAEATNRRSGAIGPACSAARESLRHADAWCRCRTKSACAAG